MTLVGDYAQLLKSSCIKGFFKVERIDLSVHENAVSLKHEELFGLLRGEGA